MPQRPGRRARTAGVIAALLASAVGLTACEESVVATVSNIVDGDTIDVVHDGEERRVRLLNVDTPEATDPDAPPDCLGPEATPSSNSGNSGSSGSSGYDGYTGCRDYGTTLPPNASDEQGRPYTKIDCTTKHPIG